MNMNWNFVNHHIHVLEYQGETSCEDPVSVYSAKEVLISEILAKRSLIFALPGAFTPTCTYHHVPSIEEHYDEFLSLGVDEVYIMTVNDFYTQRVWVDSMKIKKTKVISDPDFVIGNNFMNCLYRNLLGVRHAREVFLTENDRIKARLSEQYMGNGDDPFENTKIENVIKMLKELYHKNETILD